MQSPTAVHENPDFPAQNAIQAIERAERAYRGLTIAAMLVLLCTLVF